MGTWTGGVREWAGAARRGMCVSDPEAGMKILKIAPSPQTIWSAQRGYTLPETLQLYF